MYRIATIVTGEETLGAYVEAASLLPTEFDPRFLREASDVPATEFETASDAAQAIARSVARRAFIHGPESAAEGLERFAFYIIDKDGRRV